eukprot:COSAG02_NODE_67121_length_253_cov_1.688312_2_plen_20_part_01
MDSLAPGRNDRLQAEPLQSI